MQRWPTADWDRANIEYMKKLYPGYTFYCIDMRRFDANGGAIHCVTKQIPADNPIRIIHKNIHDKVNPDKNSGIPFCAYITNKSGIKEAQLVYSVNGGPWVTVPLAGNGNTWNCWSPIDDITGGQPESGEEATGEEDTDVPSVNALPQTYDASLDANAVVKTIYLRESDLPLKGRIRYKRGNTQLMASFDLVALAETFPRNATFTVYAYYTGGEMAIQLTVEVDPWDKNNYSYINLN